MRRDPFETFVTGTLLTAIGVEGFARYSMGGGEGCLSIDGFSFGSCYHNLHPKIKTAFLISKM